MNTLAEKPKSSATTTSPSPLLLARNALAVALEELNEAQSSLGELINTEAKLEDELEAMAPKFRATDKDAVATKAALTRQAAECRAASRALENKTLPRCREALALALGCCVNPYRDQLCKEIAAEKQRLVRTLKDFYREESRAIEVAERSDKVAFLLNHLRVSWSHSCTDAGMAQLILNRMTDALAGKPIISWPPLTPSPG
jgi:hypothetical protein